MDRSTKEVIKNLKRKLSSSKCSSGEEEVEEEELLELKKEEEGVDSEPDLECDNWDNDCKIVTLKPELSLTGYHLMPTCSRNPVDNPYKKLKFSPEVRKNLLTSEFKAQFQNTWNSNKSIKENYLEIIVEPFKVCIVNDFLDFDLNSLREEFNEIEWNLRSMDLYEFFQSQDLKHLSKHDAISSVYRLLQNDVMKWVSDLTGYTLTHVSATCSLYSNTDYLLVHDDQRGDRMVAFILYLTSREGWDESKGGALQLLNKDKEGHPSDVAKNIYPTNNQLVFFPVANDSYHQVAEITSLQDCRLSINGWFHTTTPPIFTTPNFNPYPEGLFGETQHKPIHFDGELSSWLTEEYLACDVVEDIQDYFEENSEISLRNFLKREPFEEITQILQNCNLNWVKIGPPSRHCYEIADRSNLPQVLERLLQLFQSKQMFHLLQRCTGLDLSKDRARMKYELQRWAPGSYSLLGDYGWYNQKELDLVISFGCKCNSDVIGGRTMYVTMDDKVQDALITLDPEENNLNLVYRDTARFTKYYSKLSRCRCFYTLFCSYSE